MADINFLQHQMDHSVLRSADIRLKAKVDEMQRAAGAENFAAIEDAAKEFEAVFMAEMLKPMFAEIKPDENFGGGKGEEIFQGMMVQEIGKIMAARGGIGIADAVKAEMLKMQSTQDQGGPQ